MRATSAATGLAAALALLLAVAPALEAQGPATDDGRVRVGVVKNPYHGGRNVPELDLSPDYVQAGGLARLLEEWGALHDQPVPTVRLTPEQAEEYGERNRLGMANGHLADRVAEYYADDRLSVVLGANCNSILGVLGGLQQATDGSRRRVGLFFIDAHGDFNTPETSLSGMLGGMPVAVSAGHALHRLRLQSGLEEPLPIDQIVWGGVRDLDPLEEERFEEYGVHQVSVDDMRNVSPHFREQMRRLADRVDVIYVHVDMDVLDPAEVPGHDLNVPGGPTSEELGEAIRAVFRDVEKAAAIGVVSTPAGSLDPRGVSRRAALTLIEGAVKGVGER